MCRDMLYLLTRAKQSAGRPRNGKYCFTRTQQRQYIYFIRSHVLFALKLCRAALYKCDKYHIGELINSTDENVLDLRHHAPLAKIVLSFPPNLPHVISSPLSHRVKRVTIISSSELV